MAQEDLREQLYSAVAQTLSRLARKGALARVSKGLFHRLRTTAFGPSRPDPKAIKRLAENTRTILPSRRCGGQSPGIQHANAPAQRVGNQLA